ncbi:MAG: hypothetical protein ACXWQQ_04570 [Pseudobdellovibrio sp.]
MKKTIVLSTLAICLLGLSGCGGSDDTTTPAGVVTAAFKDLYKGKSQDFLVLLTGPAYEKFQTADQQKNLLNSLGDVRQLKLSDAQVISVVGDSSNSTTLYDVPVTRNSQIINVVSAVCNRVESTTSHMVCPQPPPPPSYDPNPGNGGWDHPGHGGGGWDPGHGGGNGGGGGGLTPGPSEPHGGGDPSRPPRFPGQLTEDDGCYPVYDNNVYVNCQIKDIR